MARPRYKYIKKWRPTKKGMTEVRTRVLNQKPYKFTRDGSKYIIFAPTRKEAIKKFNLFVKQKPYDFGDIVVFARTEKEARRKAATERKRRQRMKRR